LGRSEEAEGAEAHVGPGPGQHHRRRCDLRPPGGLKCKSTNAPRGEGHITVKFMPAGSAAEAVVPAFKGEVVQVGKSFRFE